MISNSTGIVGLPQPGFTKSCAILLSNQPLIFLARLSAWWDLVSGRREGLERLEKGIRIAIVRGHGIVIYDSTRAKRKYLVFLMRRNDVMDAPLLGSVGRQGR